MIYKQFLLAIIFFSMMSCQQDYQLNKIEGKRLEINDSITPNNSIEDYIKPYRDNVNKNLDSVLAYSVDTYSKTDGDLNTAIGNFMADMVYKQASPIYKSRTGKDIDMVMLNHGGIRAIISKGNITTRTAYEVMPFENSIVVVELKGVYVKELINYLQKAKRAHPISKLKIRLDQDFELLNATINGQDIIDDNVYHVATNDYLYNGGDRMDFFQKGDSLHILDYRIRNAMIDYFKSIDTLSPVIDDRFTKLN